MIRAGSIWPDAPSYANDSPAGGDPSKPGAWTRDEIDEWDQVKACAAEGHAPFWLMNPRDSEDTCPGCGAIVRSVTGARGWADHWAEQRAEERTHDDCERRAREEDARW